MSSIRKKGSGQRRAQVNGYMWRGELTVSISSSIFLGKYQSKSSAECEDKLIGSSERRNYDLLI